MSEIPPIYIILTTYCRTALALRTIQGVKQNLKWGNLGWIVTDDGSPEEDVQQLIEAIEPANHLWVYRGNHRGVGHNMNVGLEHVWGIGGQLTITLEDDWVIEKPLDMTPYVNTLLNHPEHAMIRMGYLSVGLQGTLISEEGILYWKLDNNNYQYRFCGHPSLRTRSFFDYYGMYTEGLAPGSTELAMCGAVNSKNGPSILIPADSGWYGFFYHCGDDSLADIVPGEGG